MKGEQTIKIVRRAHRMLQWTIDTGMIYYVMSTFMVHPPVCMFAFE